jgi:hypothetical protein
VSFFGMVMGICLCLVTTDSGINLVEKRVVVVQFGLGGSTGGIIRTKLLVLEVLVEGNCLLPITGSRVGVQVT